MAHLLNTHFVPSSQTLHRRSHSPQPALRISGRRSRAKIRETFMPALMTEGKRVKSGGDSGVAVESPPSPTAVPFGTVQGATSKSMVESLSVPTFRVGHTITAHALCKKIFQREFAMGALMSTKPRKFFKDLLSKDIEVVKTPLLCLSTITIGQTLSLISAPTASASDNFNANAVYEVGELFELGIQLSYLLLLLAFLGVGSFFVIRQVLVRRELDLSAKELQEQVRSGDASATEYFELGAVMLRRKFYPAAIKYLLQAIEKWDGDDQDLAQVHNALGVSYTLDGKLDKGITEFETAVKLQPGYVTAWNNLGDAYEKKKEYKSALKAFEEVLLFDPNNKVARPRRDFLKDKVQMLRGVPVKSKETR